MKPRTCNVRQNQPLWRVWLERDAEMNISHFSSVYSALFNSKSLLLLYIMYCSIYNIKLSSRGLPSDPLDVSACTVAVLHHLRWISASRRQRWRLRVWCWRRHHQHLCCLWADSQEPQMIASVGAVAHMHSCTRSRMQTPPKLFSSLCRGDEKPVQRKQVERRKTFFFCFVFFVRLRKSNLCFCFSGTNRLGGASFLSELSLPPLAFITSEQVSSRTCSDRQAW